MSEQSFFLSILKLILKSRDTTGHSMSMIRSCANVLMMRGIPVFLMSASVEWMPKSQAASSVTDVNKVNHARAATQPTCIFTLVLTRAFIPPLTPVELAPQFLNASHLSFWPCGAFAGGENGHAWPTVSTMPSHRPVTFHVPQETPSNPSTTANIELLAVTGDRLCQFKLRAARTISNGMCLVQGCIRQDNTCLQGAAVLAIDLLDSQCLASTELK